MKLVKLAVSLGNTKSLAEHPATITHSDLSRKDKEEAGITDKMIRISIGVEYHIDIIADLEQAMAKV